LAGFKAAGMSIADDPFCRGLPQASCDRIEAALIRAQRIMEGFGKDRDELRRMAYEMGVSSSSIDFAPGNTILEDADDMQRQGVAMAAPLLHYVACFQWWKALRPDIDAFVAKAWEACHWVNQKLRLNPSIPPNEFEFKRNWREFALLQRADSEEADSRNGAQSNRNKTAPPDRESREARAARRQAFLEPLLDKEGILVNEWEERAGVAKNTARKFWDGSTVRLRPGTCKKLAKALNVEPEELPD
jgi:hypothetical protein